MCIRDRYTIGAVSGELPDIGMVDSPDMASYISLGVFADITEYLEGWSDLDQFYEGPLSSCMDADGKYYGLPNNSNCLALLCNMDLLKAAGIENPPTTWDEFKEACEKTTDEANGVYGFAMSAIANEEGTCLLYTSKNMKVFDFSSGNPSHNIYALSLIHILDLRPKYLEEIFLQVELNPGEIQEILLKLELKGLVAEPVKNYYARTGG